MPANPTENARTHTVAELRKQLQEWERRSQRGSSTLVSTGCEVLDALLPGHGIRLGSVVEWIGDGSASGAGTLSLLVGRKCCEMERPMILIDFHREVYPVALAAFGFDLSKLIVVHPHSEQEALWACEESLRSKAVAIVWAKVEHLTGIAFRRLQLAAEESGGIGFLVRSTTALKQPSWADVRLVVTPRPSRCKAYRFQVSVAYSRGETMRSVTDIEIDALRGTFYEVVATSQTHRLPAVS